MIKRLLRPVPFISAIIWIAIMLGRGYQWGELTGQINRQNQLFRTIIKVVLLVYVGFLVLANGLILYLIYWSLSA